MSELTSRRGPHDACIDLAYVGLGLHEQLVAYVADQLGYFCDEGVHVALRDGRRWPIDRLRSGAVVGLGRTQVSRLRDGIPWTVACVNTDRPMFWLVATPGHETVADLHGRRLGMHAPTSAPGLWARITLRRHGVDPDEDVTAIAIPAGDYRTHLEMLRSGEIDAAVLGSTLAVDDVAERDGLRVLAYVGDEVRIPTTGVAVDPGRVDPDGAAVRGLVAAHRRALATLRDDPETAVAHIVGLIPGLSERSARALYDRYIASGFTVDGLAERSVTEQGLAALASELGVSGPPPITDIYPGTVRAG